MAMPKLFAALSLLLIFFVTCDSGLAASVGLATIDLDDVAKKGQADPVGSRVAAVVEPNDNQRVSKEQGNPDANSVDVQSERSSAQSPSRPGKSVDVQSEFQTPVRAVQFASVPEKEGSSHEDHNDTQTVDRATDEISATFLPPVSGRTSHPAGPSLSIFGAPCTSSSRCELCVEFSKYYFIGTVWKFPNRCDRQNRQVCYDLNTHMTPVIRQRKGYASVKCSDYTWP